MTMSLRELAEARDSASPASRPLASGRPKQNGGKEKFENVINSVQIIGFIGKDPERRQARGNGAAFTVLSVATQRSWKNAGDEWDSKTEWHRVGCLEQPG
jgi:hypothetical protein